MKNVQQYLEIVEKQSQVLRGFRGAISLFKLQSCRVHFLSILHQSKKKKLRDSEDNHEQMHSYRMLGY